MHHKFSNYLRVLKISSGIGMVALAGCAHELRPVVISATSSPTTEIANQRRFINFAYDTQTDVLAAKDFKKAESYLTDAQSEIKTGATPEKILEAVGYSQAYLNKANDEAILVKTNISEISDARIAALNAGARDFPKELNAIDNNLKKLISDPLQSSSIKAEDKKKLQSQYLNLELLAIKSTNLFETKSILNLAKKKGAEKLIPVAYKEAVGKINIAEKIIEIDRHNSDKIGIAVKEATDSSHRVFSLLESEENSKNQTAEQRAMALEASDIALKQANIVKGEAEAESTIKDEQLSVQGENLLASEIANKELKKNELADKMVEDAAAQFDKSEALVYRQDGNLVIRLKTINFATNRSDLPAASLVVLNKVKEVMKELGTKEVTVEGHTDAVGDAVRNQKLSEKRAESVVAFFIADKFFAGDKIASVGYGYSKPLSLNKTKEGRAQNRRVDIIIKTNQTNSVHL